MKKISLLIVILLSVQLAVAQTGIGTNAPNDAAALEIDSPDKGLLLPRVALTGTDAATPLGAHVNGMLVYNTATAGAGATAVTPGLYYNQSGAWQSIAPGDNVLPGTATLHNTLRWDGSAWVESNGISNDGAGAVVVNTELTVNGAAHNNAAYDAGAGTTIDFAQSNFAYTTASAGAFTLSNLKDGGAYTLAVQGATAGTASFTATGFTFMSKDAATATEAGTHTIYSFIVLGTTVYYTQVTGL